MAARTAADLPPRTEVAYRRIWYTKMRANRWVSDDGARFTDALVDIMLGDGAVFVIVPTRATRAALEA